MGIKLSNVSLSIPIGKKSFTKSSRRVHHSGRFYVDNGVVSIKVLSSLSVSFEKGERVGLVGHNGAGKSSFIRLLSGIYSPTSGVFETSMNVIPMLQPSFLTNPELSGFEACRAYFLFNGGHENDFGRFFQSIVDFSGLSEFIDMPIKTYSNGMISRLMFTLLTEQRYDCLAIDEVFGCSDLSFYDKAQKRMDEFVYSSSTVFFASHSADILKRYCSRGILFREGKIVYDSDMEDCLRFYCAHGY